VGESWRRLDDPNRDAIARVEAHSPDVILRRPRSRAAAVLAAVLAVSACQSSNAPSGEPPSTQSASATASSTPNQAASPSPSGPSPSGAALASGAALPDCTPNEPPASATVTFVAEGKAWAMSPNGGDLTCLFAVTDAGPFAWGPLGDRVLLGSLEVKGVAGGPSLPASEGAVAAEWSRPTGKTIVYAPDAGSSLKKVQLNRAPTQVVTPVPSATYLSVAYHPSGEAFAFALSRSDGQSIWLSTNLGAKPVTLVFSVEGTTFGAMGFDVGGKHLIYAAQHADNHGELHSIDITDPTKAPVLWEGPAGKTVPTLIVGPTTGTVAWTSQASCDDSTAMVLTDAGAESAAPDATGPTRAVGWLDASHLLVAEGACDGPLDLSAVDLTTGSVVSLVSGVALAATRAPVPTPFAALPKNVVLKGSGFS
jgi:hypothetical protein